MGRKTDLQPEEKQRILELLSHGKTSLHILKLIRRDHHTVKRFMENSDKGRGRADKGRFRKISRREISSVKKSYQKILIQRVRRYFMKLDCWSPIKIQCWTVQDLKKHWKSYKANY